jgi:hypothetical protein
MEDRLLKTKKEKLHFVLKELKITNRDIVQKTDLQSNVVSEITNPQNFSRTLKNYHLFAITFAYNIPIEIFNKNITSSSQIKKILQRANIKQKNLIDETLINGINIEKLVGSWFIYSYIDNIKMRSKFINDIPIDKEISFIKEEKITIDNNLKIEMENRHKAKIEIYSNQSIITFEDINSKDIIIYTFDNDRVCYDKFFISKISKTKHSKQEILNFGFFSKKKLQESEAQFILGDFTQTQLKVNCNLLDRISSYNENY